MMVGNRSIFLIDAVGALASTLLLGVVLPSLQDLIGMPVSNLYFLALCAASFMLYSLFCFKFADHRNPRWLKVLMVVNLGYCCLTSALVLYHFAEMTVIGIVYFVIEIVVILALVTYENKVSARGTVPLT